MQPNGPADSLSYAGTKDLTIIVTDRSHWDAQDGSGGGGGRGELENASSLNYTEEGWGLAVRI